jgi:hypothetical protein
MTLVSAWRVTRPWQPRKSCFVLPMLSACGGALDNVFEFDKSPVFGRLESSLRPPISPAATFSTGSHLLGSLMNDEVSGRVAEVRMNAHYQEVASSGTRRDKRPCRPRRNYPYPNCLAGDSVWGRSGPPGAAGDTGGCGMRRIKMVLSVGVVMVALLALNAGSAMASEIEELEIDGDEVEIELVGGGDLEFEDLDGEDVFSFGVLDVDDDDDDDDDEREVTRIVDIG